MYNWRLLAIALLAACQPIACFSGRALVDGRQRCERDTAEVFPNIRHSYDQRKTGDRQAPTGFQREARETHRDERRSELRIYRFSDLRTSSDRVRGALNSRARYTTYSDFDAQRLFRASSERIRDNRNDDRRLTERFRERTFSLSTRRFEPDTRITPVRDVRRDYEGRDSPSGGVLRETRSIRATLERESRHNEGRGIRIRDDILRFEATRRERRSDSTLERREVTRRTREVSTTRRNIDERLVRLNGQEPLVRDRAVVNDRESTRTSDSSTRDSRRSYSLPNHRVQLLRRDLSRTSSDELRERDDIRRMSRQRSMAGDRQRSRSVEKMSENRERQMNIRLLARERIEESRLSREQGIRSARNSVDVRRNDLARDETRADRFRLQRNSRISQREPTRDIQRSSPRDVRFDGNQENRNVRSTDRVDARRARTSFLTRYEALERGSGNSRYRSQSELGAAETPGIQRASATHRSKDAEYGESQFLAENWKALAFYTLQGLYLCSMLFRVFSNTSPDKKKARLPNWWPTTRRAIKQD